MTTPLAKLASQELGGVDPFTRTERAIWIALESLSVWTGLVEEGNRIKLSDETESGRDLGGKRNPGEGDLPEVILVPIGGATEAYTSDSFRFVQRYGLEMSTGSLKGDGFNALKWATLRAAYQLREPVQELPWVIHVIILPWDESLDDKRANRPGFAGRFVIEVLMGFNDTEIEQWA